MEKSSSASGSVAPNPGRSGETHSSRSDSISARSTQFRELPPRPWMSTAGSCGPAPRTGVRRTAISPTSEVDRNSTGAGAGNAAGHLMATRSAVMASRVRPARRWPPSADHQSAEEAVVVGSTQQRLASVQQWRRRAARLAPLAWAGIPLRASSAISSATTPTVTGSPVDRRLIGHHRHPARRDGGRMGHPYLVRGSRAMPSAAAFIVTAAAVDRVGTCAQPTARRAVEGCPSPGLRNEMRVHLPQPGAGGVPGRRVHGGVQAGTARRGAQSGSREVGKVGGGVVTSSTAPAPRAAGQTSQSTP